MKRFFLFSWLMCLAIMANAEAVSVGGLTYWVNNAKTEAGVNPAPSGVTYSGIIDIPNSISYGDGTIPVTSINDGAFSSTNNLTKVTIPSSVTSIGSNAFKNSSIAVIIIGENVTTIGSNAFNGASNLTEISIPAKVTSIGGSAFQGCTGLTTAIFASPAAMCGITFDGNTSNPLYYAKHLYFLDSEEEVKNLTIPSTISSIPAYAFQNCSCLISITIEEEEVENDLKGVTTIGEYAFTNCSGLISISIPSTVKEIGKNAFSNAFDTSSPTLTRATFNSISSLCSIDFGNVNSNPLTGAHHLFVKGKEEEETKITLPSTPNIKPRVFAGASFITEVTIPGEVDSIGEDAFLNCTKITTVYYSSPEKLTKIQCPKGIANPLYYGAIPVVEGMALGHLDFDQDISDKAFTNSKWITDITIGPNVKTIGKNAFKSCSNLNSITFQEGSTLTTIDEDAFNGCLSLTSINLPNTLTNIGKRAFRDTKLTEITLPLGCTNLGESVFEICTALTSAYFELANLTTIPKNIFKGCNNLITVTIPEKIDTIGEGSFQGCIKLTTLPLSDHLTIIEKNAFNGCTGLKELMLSGKGKLAELGESAFSGCSNITMVSLPSTIDKIFNYAFSGCTSLADLYILRETLTFAPDYR